MNGSFTHIRRAPWQLSLRENKRHKCGASLITRNRALSSAKCYDSSLSLSNYAIVAGSTLRICDQNGFRIPIEKYIRHPKYDIAVIWLEYEIKYSVYMQPIMVAETNIESIFSDSSFSDEGKIAGWGLSDPENYESGSTTLRTIMQRILLKERCERMCNKNLPDGMFCGTSNTQQTTHGDNGGALNANGVQIGILSEINFCTVQQSQVSAYTSIHFHYQWIQKNL